MDQSVPPTISNIPPHSIGYANQKPYIRILEQPVPCNLRFRYECEIERRFAGSIVGINNTSEKRTFPTIQVMNYQGDYAVVVSCVAKDGPPYRPHPHNLVGKKNCKRGVHTQLVSNPHGICSFPNLGIQRVKNKDIEKSLKIREKYNLDPFGTGFNHPGNIDLKVLRLCFQVFLRVSNKQLMIPIPPVVSDPIYDKKAMTNLTIMKLSHYSAPVTGGTEVIILCDRVAKEDIQIWFFEEQGSRRVWESAAEFLTSDVHKQVAISFRTPLYINENIQHPVPVFIELRKPSENKKGDPRPFQYLPMERDTEGLARKKQKVKERIDLDKYFQGIVLAGGSVTHEHQIPIEVPRVSRQLATQQKVKAESLLVRGGACGDDFFTGASSSYASAAEYSAVPVLPPVSVPMGVPPTSSHLIPSHFPNLAASPGSHSHSSATPPLESMPSPAMHQMMPSSETSNQQNAQVTVDDAMIEKFDSLDLDIDLNLNLTQNIFASLFDSIPSITEPTYQELMEQLNE